jgi:hypothetical protein
MSFIPLQAAEHFPIMQNLVEDGEGSGGSASQAKKANSLTS